MGDANLMAAALALEGAVFNTPPRPARPPAAAPPERSLYTAGGRPDLRAGMRTDQAFGELAGWLAQLHDAGALVTARPPAADDGADPGPVVARTVCQLRRDMMLACDDSPTGPTLVVMGLLVPVEVCALHRTTHRGEAAWRIEFLAQSPGGEVRLKTLVRDVLGELERDMVYALGPALAAFLRSHDVGTWEQLLAAAGGLTRRTGHRPVVPARVLAPALPDAAGLHIGRRLVEARAALLACDYHVPALGYVPLQDGSLEDWLRLTMRGAEAVRRKAVEVDELTARLTAAVQDLCALARIGGLLPSPRR